MKLPVHSKQNHPSLDDGLIDYMVFFVDYDGRNYTFSLDGMKPNMITYHEIPSFEELVHVINDIASIDDFLPEYFKCTLIVSDDAQREMARNWHDMVFGHLGEYVHPEDYVSTVFTSSDTPAIPFKTSKPYHIFSGVVR
jgi:hypothetical protein